MLLNIPFQSLSYRDIADGKTPEALRLEADKLGEKLSLVTVPTSAAFQPIHMEVIEGSSQRGDIPARVCLLGKDKVTYKVYALPRDWEPKMDAILQEDVMMDE